VTLVVDGSGYSYAEHKKRHSPLLGPEPPSHDGRRVAVSQIDTRILLAGLEHVSMADVLALFPDGDVTEVRRRVDALCDQGMLCLRPRRAEVRESVVR
jgi:hypothetical protein